jgi:hypothetical protein
MLSHTHAVMKHGFYKRVGKVCALVVTTSLLPLLAYADKDKDKGKEDKDRDDRHPVVPQGKRGMGFGAVCRCRAAFIMAAVF